MSHPRPEASDRTPARPPTSKPRPAGRPGKLILDGDENTVPPPLAELDPKARNELYELAKSANYDIPRLQAMSITELMALATAEDLSLLPGLGKKEIIFEILRARITKKGLGWGEGVLDILPDGFGFLRSPRYDYEPGPDDIYVSPSQVRRLNLKQGHVLAGPVRPPKQGEKYFALLHVEAVNGGTVEELRRRIPFGELTPVLPADRLRLEFPGCDVAMRLLDLLAPIGKGQRALVDAPPQSGRTLLLTRIAKALLRNHPELFVIMCLIDERPEDVTDVLNQTESDEGHREVAASTFDQPASRHVALAEMTLAKAQRMVEAGRDVVILLDSLTALVRAYNQETPHSGKILSAGLDTVALQRPKQLFGAARNVEEGGSLTVIASVLTDTGSAMNDAIAEEFAGKGNCEIVLDRQLAEQHVYPALDTARTGTRREDILLPPDQLGKVRRLRGELAELVARERLQKLVADLESTESNDEFLAGY